MSYSFTNLEILEILEILELSYQFIMFFAEMFRKMPETVLYALMPNVTRFFFINNIINQKYLKLLLKSFPNLITVYYLVGMRRGTVVRRRTRNRAVRGSYPAAVAIAIYHRLICSPTTSSPLI